MKEGTLVVWITKGDDKFTAYKGRLEGLSKQYQVSYHSSSASLGNYDGDGSYPLILVSHANEKRFTTDQSMYPKTRESATTVAQTLKEKGLVADRFNCVLVAGCKGASSNKEDSLYIDLGNSLNRPIIASNEPVKMSMDGDTLTLTPENGGKWKVFFPNEEEVASLTSPRCSELRTAIERSHFRCY